MTQVKKNYASLIRIQEGNMVPEDKQLDVKGIECMTKSSKAKRTRDALKKILVEDILKAPVIDQMKFYKDMRILEKQIMNSLINGSREFYKPATIKSLNAYDDPMRIQGVKGAYAWNLIRPHELPAIDLEERNAVDIVKVVINRGTVEKIKDKYPDVYNNIIETLDREEFKKYVKDSKTGQKTKLVANEIDAISLPLDIEVPDWLMEFVDFDELISDNIGGFPYASIGIFGGFKKGVNCTNIVQL